MQFSDETSDIVPFTFNVARVAEPSNSRLKHIVPSSVSIWSRWRIPQELTDEIIDHLHNDRAALCSCSLVCHSWLQSSSLHLFRSVKVPKCGHSRTAISRCNCTMLDSSRHRVFANFLERLQDSPRMYAHIRDLCLSGKTDERKVKSLSLCGHTLDEILSCLTALRHLTLYDCELDLPSSPSRTNGTLDSLTIIHRSKLGREFPSAGLINLLARFQHISKLTFDGCETRELLPQKALCGSKPLRNLKIARMEFARCSPSSQDHIAMALLRSFNIRNILCVQLSGLGSASHVTFDNLLRSSKRIESVGLVATTDLPILRRDIPLITGKVAIFFSLLRRHSFAALKSVDVVIHLRCRCLHDVHGFSCLYRNHDLMRRSLEELDWAAIDTVVGLFASAVHFIFTINKTPVILKQEAYDALLGTVVDGVTFPLRLRHSVSLVAREVIA